MAEEEIIDKREIISTCQPISILSYDQYIVVIERKVKDQIQIFETEATLYESEEIGLVNLHIPVKNHSYIKIPIYNNIGNVIKIPERTTIGYLITEIENQLPNTIPDFLQLKPFIITTNASGQVLEAVLSQRGPDKRKHLVAYASRSLNPAEKNYRTPALEHLAIYWAVIK
ncbi:hypothetical protein G9A89_021299 [Geosiphon pyriformis]|nr:hypothetical protein G9A89_021299 [Geosiphon pyriformis]